MAVWFISNSILKEAFCDLAWLQIIDNKEDNRFFLLIMSRIINSKRSGYSNTTLAQYDLLGLKYYTFLFIVLVLSWASRPPISHSSLLLFKFLSNKFNQSEENEGKIVLTFDILNTFSFHAPVVTHIVAMFQTTSVWIVLTHIDISYNKRKHW